MVLESNKRELAGEIHRAIDTVRPGQLAELFNLDGFECRWTEVDLAALWSQQLKRGILEDLVSEYPESATHFEQMCREALPRVETFAELLGGSSVPVALIDAVRRAVKNRVSSSRGTGIDLIARALYFAAIAVLIRSGARQVTKLSEGELSAGFSWVLGQSWVDGNTQQVVRGAWGVLAQERGTPNKG